jgi:hypothetical protein
MAMSSERPIEQPTVQNLPSYLGFGTLDPASVHFDGEHLSAHYQYGDGDIAYRVDWQSGRCLLEAQFHGEPVSISGGRDLQSALFQSFLGRAEPADDPRFVDLCQRVVGSGNIYFQFPQAFRRGSPGYLYYPAGLLFSLRLPIVRENRPAWDVFRIVARSGEGLPMSLDDEGPGAIISLTPGGEPYVEEIEIAQFVTPLYQVLDACRIIAEHRLIAPEQTYRVSVADASVVAPGGLQVYQGHAAGGPALFATVAADPESELPWKDQVAMTTDRLVEFATGLAGGADRLVPSRS